MTLLIAFFFFFAFSSQLHVREYHLVVNKTRFCWSFVLPAVLASLQALPRKHLFCLSVFLRHVWMPVLPIPYARSPACNLCGFEYAEKKKEKMDFPPPLCTPPPLSVHTLRCFFWATQLPSWPPLAAEVALLYVCVCPCEGNHHFLTFLCTSHYPLTPPSFLTQRTEDYIKAKSALNNYFW
jgi:hypothetical protein